jgi:putative transposase
MPQSLSQVLVQVVFSTKDRRPWLDVGMAPRMQADLATIVRDHDGQADRVGDAADHVHLAVGLARTISQAGTDETRRWRSGGALGPVSWGCRPRLL